MLRFEDFGLVELVRVLIEWEGWVYIVRINLLINDLQGVVKIHGVGCAGIFA